MSFRQVEQQKASEQVIDQIEKLILHGVLKPNEKLPPERQLATELNVSRPVLREALTDLSSKGLITTRHGSGVFVSDFLSSAFAPALIDLFTSHEEAHADFLRFRREIEGIAAERAARFGLESEHEEIKRTFDKMEAAHDVGDTQKEFELDADFHMAIMEASQNVFMLHMFRSMFEMLKQGVFFNREIMFEKSTTRGEVMRQHKCILNAILDRDGDRAKEKMIMHIDFIGETVRITKELGRKEEIVALRQAHKPAK